MGKRLCFDTESSYHPGSRAIGIWDVEDCRSFMQEKIRRTGPIRFDCGVVYDEESNRYLEFSSRQAHALVATLAVADALISQNGKRWDLLILEQVCGHDVVEPLWSIRHHDLLDEIEIATLEQLAATYVPGCLPVVEREFDAACRRNKELWPDIRLTSSYVGAPDERFIPGKLAKARRDVDLTYAVFREFELHGRRPARRTRRVVDCVTKSFLA